MSSAAFDSYMKSVSDSRALTVSPSANYRMPAVNKSMCQAALDALVRHSDFAKTGTRPVHVTPEVIRTIGVNSGGTHMER
jgi:hypothetical protein